MHSKNNIADLERSKTMREYNNIVFFIITRNMPKHIGSLAPTQKLFKDKLLIPGDEKEQLPLKYPQG